MAKYRKKPVVVDVEQYTGDNSGKIKAFAGSCFSEETENINPYIRTLEGNMAVTKGDYIIKGVNGEFYPCKPDIFEKTYELVEE